MTNAVPLNLNSPTGRGILALLLNAYEKAKKQGQDALDAGIPGTALLSVGITVEELVSLCARGLVEHFHKLAGQGDSVRLRRTSAGRISEESIFVLSREGLLIARREFEDLSTRPRWDASRRQLWLGSVLVKQFPHAAICQELILAALQEQEWPVRIDSPLSQNGDGHERLRNAVKKLNHHQENALIHFSCDGSGQGITWRMNVARHAE